jgi:hypothetical protein
LLPLGFDLSRIVSWHGVAAADVLRDVKVLKR